MAETLGFLLLGGLEVTVFAAEATAFGSLAVSVPVGSVVIAGGVTVAGVVGTAALIGASVATAYALQPNVPKPSDGSQPLRQPIPARPFGYGRTRLAGAYMLFEVDPATKASRDVLALHQGRIGTPVLTYLNSDIVILNASGGVIDLGNAVNDTRYQTTAGTPIVFIKVNLGLDTETAFADVTAALPTLWTSAHRGDGVASLMLKCGHVAPQFTLDDYPYGLPKPSIVADLSPIWDPRDEDQDREDPDTWAFSSNPVLQLIDYLTQDRGPGLDYEVVIAPVLDAWMAEADACDELVAKADGSTEPRYKSDGWAYLTTDPAEVISAILATCDGWLVENGDGTLALRVGKFSAPGVTLTDADIVGFSIDKGVGDEDIINEVKFSYCAPANNYREAHATWRDEPSIAELGRVKSQTMTLSWVQSHSQGRRLAKRVMARNQARARGQLVTRLYGLKALGQRWVKVQSPTIDDLADAVIEITRANIDLANARVTLEWFLINPNVIDAWDPQTEEGNPPAFFPTPENVAAAEGTADDDNKIVVTFADNDPQQVWLDYAVDYRLGTSGPWTRQVFTSYTPSDGTITLVTSTVAAGTYSVRVAVIGPQGHTNDLVWGPSITGITGVVVA